MKGKTNRRKERHGRQTEQSIGKFERGECGAAHNPAGSLAETSEGSSGKKERVWVGGGSRGAKARGG